MKHLKTLITLAIGVILLAALLYSIGIGAIAGLLSKTNILMFVAAGIAYTITEFMLALKLKITVPELSVKQIFLSSQGGMFFSNLTPGRAGYFYAAYSLAKKVQSSISEKLGLITLVQGLMMAMKVITLVIAFAYFSTFVTLPASLWIAFIIPIAIVLLCVFILYTKVSHAVLARIPLLNRVVKYLDLMQSSAKAVSRKKMAQMFALDFLGWFFIGWQFYFLANALGIPMPYLTAFMLQPLLSAMMFIPISPAGLGLAEGGNVIIFLLLGFTAPQAIGFALLWRINNIVFDGITGIWDLRIVKLPERWSI
ncbi:MAG: lysylphosphatidylglycerol synthase transmembrane domain-containing protein [Candidatus Aenigmatarchaeota archaeon]